MIDNSLLVLYVINNNEKILNFIKSNNDCFLPEIEEFLLENNVIPIFIEKTFFGIFKFLSRKSEDRI